MIKHNRFFNSNGRNTEIIDRLVSKISRGQFQVEDLKWVDEEGSRNARITVKIQGTESSTGFRRSGVRNGSIHSDSSSSDESLTPGEKRVQKQVANCYL